jgi:hypothetical protein
MAPIGGLIGVFISAHLDWQFEFIKSEWVNDGNFIGYSGEKNPVAGHHDGTGSVTIPQKPVRRRLLRILPGAPSADHGPPPAETGGGPFSCCPAGTAPRQNPAIRLILSCPEPSSAIGVGRLRSCSGNETTAHAVRHGVSAVADSQLPEQPPGVCLNGVLRQMQFPPDLAVAQTSGHTAQHLKLALGQLDPIRPGAISRTARSLRPRPPLHRRLPTDQALTIPPHISPGTCCNGRRHDRRAIRQPEQDRISPRKSSQQLPNDQLGGMTPLQLRTRRPQHRHRIQKPG